MTALLYAARDGHLDSVKLFVAANVDVNQTEANGIAPLLMAITNAHFDVAEFLLDHGASVIARRLWRCLRSCSNAAPT
jgi:ankyrin repeat protein